MPGKAYCSGCRFYGCPSFKKCLIMGQHFRKTPMAKKYKVVEVAGYLIITWVFDDLDDQLLQEHLSMAVYNEDFEYAEAVSLEAESRGIKLKVKKWK